MAAENAANAAAPPSIALGPDSQARTASKRSPADIILYVSFFALLIGEGGPLKRKSRDKKGLESSMGGQTYPFDDAF